MVLNNVDHSSSTPISVNQLRGQKNRHLGGMKPTRGASLEVSASKPDKWLTPNLLSAVLSNLIKR